VWAEVTLGGNFEFSKRPLPAARFGVRPEHIINSRKENQMPTMEIVKAWKDEEYRDTLTMEQLAQLPEHPSGIIEFEQPQLEDEGLFGPEVGRCKIITHYTNNNGKKCR
jgi:mersacidin/lichenicidin family type 2 lantibiotic